MKQVKRLFYMVLLNVIISAITVGVVLKLWERDHPTIPAEMTPVIIVVTSTPSLGTPATGSNLIQESVVPLGTSIVISGTVQSGPTPETLVYRVKQGDTLGALSVQFNVSVDDIMTVNGITDPNSVFIGQILNIPTAPLPRETPTAVPVIKIASLTPRPSTTPTVRPTSTSSMTPDARQARVSIETVIGAGVLANEHIVLRLTGNGQISLAAWRLTDGASNTYIFPELTLYKDNTVNLNSRTGQNTVADLFWNLQSPIWSSGKSISLYDAKNNLQTTYTVP